jgi:quinol monooxygenase YgiN
MMLGLMLLVVLFEQWRARRRLKKHIEATAGAQARAAEMAMQIQREEFLREIS